MRGTGLVGLCCGRCGGGGVWCGWGHVPEVRLRVVEVVGWRVVLEVGGVVVGEGGQVGGGVVVVVGRD